MRKSRTLALAGFAGLWFAGIAAGQSINAAGATFPNAIYSQWFNEFKNKTGAQINYQSIGSGAGIQQLTAGTVDFGASDAPMTDAQIAELKVKPLHFPTVLGGVAIIYNVPGVSQQLKFSADTVAGIFLGKIGKWNDAAIAKDNPGVKLPSQEIVVVHRSDGSGTTFVFTDYLGAVSAEWKSRVGTAPSPKWPAGTGQKGSDGVSGMVKQTPGSIGYVELIYATQNKISYATLKNKSGAFVNADANAVTAAAAGAAKAMPADFRVSIVDAPGKGAYPISTFTWLLIPSRIPDAAKRKAIANFLQWMLTDGQKEAEGLGYAPLPKEVVAKELKQISLVK
ncbi:MAG: phosphate ABC transporter substrate-binding protein PstS [Bryobacteraceae bacterium]|jgi:phosphate transport system substrate-binding protein